MKKAFLSLIVFMSFVLHAHCTTPRIVGLMAFRNEENFLAQHLKALSLFTDAIVVLDDASTDNSLKIAYDLQKECNIEKIIEKDIWFRDEPGDRNKLLQAGREIGGTHFICIDADEMISSNLLIDNQLRNTILKLQPLEALALTWVQLWRSVDYYRNDDSIWTNQQRIFIFCDDGLCSYQSEFIHTHRTPLSLKKVFRFPTDDFGLIHFQFVNWDNLLLKQAWYRCLEHVRNPDKSISEINYSYGRSKDEIGLSRSPSKPGWLQYYPFFDASVYEKPDNWRKQQVNEWFDQYGKDYFKELDIWDVDWAIKKECYS